MPFPIIPILTPLAISIAGFMGFRNTNKNTETNKDLAKKQQGHQLKLALLNIEAQKKLEKSRQDFQEKQENERKGFQIGMSLLERVVTRH